MQSYIDGFIAAIRTEREWIDDFKNRQERKEYFKRLLGRENIDSLSQDQLAQIIRELWASLFWTDKNQPVNRVFSKTSFPEVRSALKKLLYDDKPIGKRYDAFRAKVSGLGTSSLTEILCFNLPNECCIWNIKPRRVLPFLKLDSKLPKRVFKYPNIDGSDYEKCNDVMHSIMKMLKEKGLEDADFVLADSFMWFVFNKIPKEIPTPPLTPPEIKKKMTDMEISSHSDAQAILLELGNMHGYETYVADPSKTYQGKKLGDIANLSGIPEEFKNIKHIDKIDVIWFGDTDSYFFEIVESIGTLDKSLRRLSNTLRLNSKLFVIAPADYQSEFEKCMCDLSYRAHRDRYNFRPYQTLVSFYQLSRDFSDAKKDFFRG